jgi:hypothetical protein
MGIIFLPSAVLLSGTKMIRLLGEHRLFSQISNNWAGRPLERYNLQTVLKYIRTTETAKGLRVNTRLLRRQYEKGEGLADQQMRGACADQPHSTPRVELQFDSRNDGKLFLRNPLAALICWRRTITIYR